MTVKQLFDSCDHIGHSETVQLFKQKEHIKYFSDSFENLTFERMSMRELIIEFPNLEIDRFWFDGVDNSGNVKLVMLLMKGDELI